MNLEKFVVKPEPGRAVFLDLGEITYIEARAHLDGLLENAHAAES